MSSLLRNMADSLIDHVTSGAIIGCEGGIWVQTPGFFPAQRDLDDLLAACDGPEKVLQRGVIFQNDRYLVTHKEGGMLVAKNAFGSIILCKCESCVVFTFMEVSCNFADGLEATEKLTKWVRETPVDDLE